MTSPLWVKISQNKDIDASKYDQTLKLLGSLIPDKYFYYQRFDSLSLQWRLDRNPKRSTKLNSHQRNRFQTRQVLPGREAFHEQTNVES